MGGYAAGFFALVFMYERGGAEAMQNATLRHRRGRAGRSPAGLSW